MRIASLTLSAFSHPLHALARWLQPAIHGGYDHGATVRPARTCKVPVPAHAAPACPAAARMPRDEAMQTAAGARGLQHGTTPGTDAAHGHTQAPHVVRVLRTAASGADAGRLVISGRMADVCAELDRMAAREALQH